MVAYDTTNGFSDPRAVAGIGRTFESLDLPRELGTLFGRQLSNQGNDVLNAGRRRRHLESMVPPRRNVETLRVPVNRSPSSITKRRPSSTRPNSGDDQPANLGRRSEMLDSPRSTPSTPSTSSFPPSERRCALGTWALHDLAFLEKGINPLFIGTPGTGKTFLARALAYQACRATRRVVVVSAPRMLNELHGAELDGTLERALRRFVRAELLVIDDFAVLAMNPAQARETHRASRTLRPRERLPHRPASATSPRG